MSINTNIIEIKALGANGPLFKGNQQDVIAEIIDATNTNTTAIAAAVAATPIFIAGSDTLNFGSTVAGASTNLTIAVAGAALGDPVILGVPNASTLANGLFTAWVSAADVVTVRFSNNNLVAALDPASGVFNVAVLSL
jgi:hypothetical protein